MFVDASNAFRLLDVKKRRLAECHEDVEFPKVPSGMGAWGGDGSVRPLCGIAFNPEEELQSMIFFNPGRVIYYTVVRSGGDK